MRQTLSRAACIAALAVGLAATGSPAASADPNPFPVVEPTVFPPQILGGLLQRSGRELPTENAAAWIIRQR